MTGIAAHIAAAITRRGARSSRGRRGRVAARLLLRLAAGLGLDLLTRFLLGAGSGFLSGAPLFLSLARGLFRRAAQHQRLTLTRLALTLGFQAAMLLQRAQAGRLLTLVQGAVAGSVGALRASGRALRAGRGAL
ncbi:hypothetical protein HMPREF9946_04081, partial [Acetobacteraceae bacterium AT-5844]